MTDSRFPRIVGFEVPDLQKAVDPDRDEPIVGLLDVAPSEEWAALFEEEVGALTGQLDSARVSVMGDRLLFFGSIRDARRLSESIRALVDRVSHRQQNERLTGDRADANNLGESSFRRNS